ncbi:hypothetical protein DVR09_13110 [Erythrobacter aureus]|uniref:Uncharacterized protein n=1 Tax=Erythrobacter aureus TaxID=2182384 RepID=A0A345YGT2_9SPHN|nr:hypothetical protein DVR09_13110 [Erythrobacter aureus]
MPAKPTLVGWVKDAFDRNWLAVCRRLRKVVSTPLGCAPAVTIRSGATVADAVKALPAANLRFSPAPSRFVVPISAKPLTDPSGRIWILTELLAPSRTRVPFPAVMGRLEPFAERAVKEPREIVSEPSSPMLYSAGPTMLTSVPSSRRSWLSPASKARLPVTAVPVA